MDTKAGTLCLQVSTCQYVVLSRGASTTHTHTHVPITLTSCAPTLHITSSHIILEVLIFFPPTFFFSYALTSNSTYLVSESRRGLKICHRVILLAIGATRSKRHKRRRRKKVKEKGERVRRLHDNSQQTCQQLRPTNKLS